MANEDEVAILHLCEDNCHKTFNSVSAGLKKFTTTWKISCLISSKFVYIHTGHST